jgi:N-acetylmuramoyl-L-alanine amidase
MRIRLLFLLLLIGLMPQSSFAYGKKITKIVLDPGHGGSDPGAVGKYSQEKNLALAISLRVGKMINDSLKDVQVIYTRTTDVFPRLQERHEIANQAGADLFISIHINATAGRTERVLSGHRYVGKGKKRRKVPVYRTIRHRETSASGTETYVLGLHRSSQQENAIGEFGDQITEEPGLLNENDPQTAIIISQYNQAFLARSVLLGSKIQEAFAAQGRRDMGVKQKGLEVLAGSAMPGVLVECGFINNPEEEAYMSSEQGQYEIAYAIFKGIRAYKYESENRP